jgi:ATP adenylyltransferase
MIQKKFFRSLTASEIFGCKNQPWDRIVFESPNFVAVPSLGHLVSGWLLIAPKEWYICMGSLPKNLFSELNEFMDHVISILQSVYGDVAIFEHGPSQEGSSVGCGVDHAHIHIVPIMPEWRLFQKAKILAPNISWTSVSAIDDTKRYFFSGKHYLFINEPATGGALIGTCNSIPRQLFRKVIASYLGKPNEFDWKYFPEIEKIQSTVDRLQFF